MKMTKVVLANPPVVYSKTGMSGNRSLYDGVPVSKNLDFGEDRPL